MQPWHTASVHDWIYCRMYTYLHRVDEGLSPYHYRLPLRRWLRQLAASAVLAAGLTVISILLPEDSPLRFMAGLLVTGIVLLFLIRTIAAPIRYAMHNEQRTRYPLDAGGEVRYAYVDAEGMRINWFNGNEDQEQDEPYIRWTHVSKIQLILTEHPRRLQQRAPAGDYLQHTMRQFEKVKIRYPNFPYRAERIYEDRLSLLITHEPAFLSQVPLPPQWSSEQLRRFLTELSSASGLPIHRYTYGRAERDEAYRQLLVKHKIMI